MILQEIVIPLELAKDLKKLGFPQDSLFAYYEENGLTIVKEKNSEDNLVCSTYVFDEIMKFIPDEIEITTDTYIIKSGNYANATEEDLNDEKNAVVTIQKIYENEDWLFMVRCQFKGTVIAFSKTSNNLYNNLIVFNKNAAEAIGLMAIELIKEGKITL
jgi:hypothetical protein